MKTGMVAMWPTSSPPTGWLLCNGAAIDPQYTALIALIGANTPNLAGKFIGGAGGSAPLNSVGGSDMVMLTVANLPVHYHGGVTGSEAGHTHAGTSGAMDANAAHGHPSSATGTVSADHSHSDPARNTGADSANHTHALTVNEGVGEGADGNYLDSNPSADPGMTFDGGSAQNKSMNHTHSVPTRNTGYSNDGAADHAHGLTLNSPSLAHTHGFSLAASSTHTHTMAPSGFVGPDSFSIVPVHTALNFVIKW